MNKENLAEKIYKNKFIIENPGASTADLFLDPVSIALILELVKQVMSCMQSRSGNSVWNSVQHPGFFDRLVLRRQVFRTLGFSEYRKTGHITYKAVLRTGHSLTMAEVNSLLVGDQG